MGIVVIDPEHPSSATLDQACEIVAAGGLVVAPTETKYGLLARADSAEALARLYEAKGRTRLQPSAVFVRDLSMLARFAWVGEQALALASRYLPGPLTLVLNARVNLPDPIVVDGKIGIRWSSSKVIAGMTQRINFPMTATSANLSGSAEPARVIDIRDQLGDAVQIYLDAGELTNRVSTVADCTGPEVRVLRVGAIPAEELLSEARRVNQG